MPITEFKQYWHLQNARLSYVLGVTELGYLALWHVGPKLRGPAVEPLVSHNPLSWATLVAPELPGFTLERLPQPLGFAGRGDFRITNLDVRGKDGARALDLRYERHSILAGKPKLEGLPQTYVEHPTEASTLTVTLKDPRLALEVDCHFTIFERYPAVAQSFLLRNLGEEALVIEQALSACVDLFGARHELITLCGGWGRERHIERAPLRRGTISIESTRGNSSHQYNPFLLLCEEGCSEVHGRALGLSLLYSGNFKASVELSASHTTRATIGIHPDPFSWRLEPSASFQTPEAVLAISDSGLEGVSQGLHALFRERLCRGTFRDRERPVVINSWEATYFDFDAERIVELARSAKPLGAELLVLDDGWFGKRDNDKSSLGDWFVYQEKLPAGLKALAESVKAEGLEFGLWFEPEMVSPDSELYRAHPDWCLGVEGLGQSQGRRQLVLDLSRADVQDYLIRVVSEVLSSAPISYVKWDMNRNQTEPGSRLLEQGRQGEVQHRYILGLYRVLEELTTRFPGVLFEGCAGGGGRFDAGMLYYMPQHWTSDNTDAHERVLIQYGTSLAYPVIAQCAHISAVPNHQLGRSTPMHTRALVAGSANLGMSLHPAQLSPEERALVAEQVSAYKERRELVQFGDFFRLLDPFTGNAGAWMFVSKDKSRAWVAYAQALATTNLPQPMLRLRGLDPERSYRVNELQGSWGGDILMAVGLLVDLPHPQGDFPARSWCLRAE